MLICAHPHSKALFKGVLYVYVVVGFLTVLMWFRDNVEEVAPAKRRLKVMRTQYDDLCFLHAMKQSSSLAKKKRVSLLLLFLFEKKKGGSTDSSKNPRPISCFNCGRKKEH